MGLPVCHENAKNQEPIISSVEERILLAGNTEDEKRRYSLLEKLGEREDLDPALALDLDKLLPIVDQWANGLEKYWRPGD